MVASPLAFYYLRSYGSENGAGKEKQHAVDLLCYTIIGISLDVEKAVQYEACSMISCHTASCTYQVPHGKTSHVAQLLPVTNAMQFIVRFRVVMTAVQHLQHACCGQSCHSEQAEEYKTVTAI